MNNKCPKATENWSPVKSFTQGMEKKREEDKSGDTGETVEGNGHSRGGCDYGMCYARHSISNSIINNGA